MKIMILCDSSYHNQSIYTSSVSIYKTWSLANCSSICRQLKMDMIKNIPVHMDYVGQGRAEKLYQVSFIPIYNCCKLSLKINILSTTIFVFLDHHRSIWCGGSWLGLHHPAVLPDGEDAADSFGGVYCSDSLEKKKCRHPGTWAFCPSPLTMYDQLS